MSLHSFLPFTQMFQGNGRKPRNTGNAFLVAVQLFQKRKDPLVDFLHPHLSPKIKSAGHNS